MSSELPRLSIGMPVYNGGERLPEVLDSLLGQTWTDFELIISDNGSTDDTPKICADAAARDPRVRFVRQTRNLGPEANFRFVLAEARAEYFMWAAADDLRSPDFVETNLSFLAGRLDHVGSVCPVRFTDGSFNALKMGDGALDMASPGARLLQFVRRRHANGRFYGIYRTQVVRSWPQLQDFRYLGADWTFVAYAASVGKIHRTSQGYLELGREGMSHKVDIFRLFRSQWLDWLAPLRRTSVDIYRLSAGQPALVRWRLAGRLVGLNVWAFLAQFLVLYRRRRRSG